MISIPIKNRSQLISQYQHWAHATTRLSKLENLASTYAWNGVDGNIKTMIIQGLEASVKQVKALCHQVELQIKADIDYKRIRKSVLQLRQQYLNTETTVHFFTDALNSRTNASIASLLKACDIICKKSMESILPALGKEVPYCFTYLDRGLGASILKSGLRLWDGSISQVAAIKITFHNLLRPTAAVHETGHQVAHILNWNQELESRLRQQLKKESPVVANAFSSWASEIAADNFAFVHTGYAAVASLHNVVAGTASSVFAFHEGDPHPISYLRVLFNIACCRTFYGKGPWDDLEESFREDYPIDQYDFHSIRLIKACEKALNQSVDVCLAEKYNAFNGKSLTDVINPQNVSPAALSTLDQSAALLKKSHAWTYKECLRLLALTGYEMAANENSLSQQYHACEAWMQQLGNSSGLS